MTMKLLLRAMVMMMLLPHHGLSDGLSDVPW